MRQIAEQSVSSRMRQTFISVQPGDSLLQAAQIMQLARIRHLPVLEAGALVGIVSHRDLLEASLPPIDERSPLLRFEQLRSITVSCAMHTSVWTVGPDQTLAEAAEQMLRHKIGCLPVVEAASGEGLGHMVGLLTESDLLSAAYLPQLDARTLGEIDPAVALASAAG